MSARNLIVNRDKPPFNDPEIRRALALTLDRKAFIDTINEGKADIGGAMLPPPEGIWGMPPEMLQALPGYDGDVAKNRGAARKIMEERGYGPDNRLKITVSTRNIPQYRDPAVILIDQLKQIYIDGDLEEIDTVNWYPKVMRKDFIVGLNLGENGLDDPDQTFYENFACGAERNYTGYCNRELEQAFDRQSMEADPGKAQAFGVGDRQKIARGRRPPDGLSQPRGNLLVSPSEGADHHGQQHLQWIAIRRRLARQIAGTIPVTIKEEGMRSKLAVLAAVACLLVAGEAWAQKSGGILKVHHWDSPASMSIIEEATYSTVVPMMGVFNNLVIYKQDEPQNSLNNIVPDLATEWSWSEDGKELTFKLRQGVKWHDGKPFTAADVKCTYDLLLGKAQDKLRLNPRKAWYRNLEQVSTNGNDEATFHLQRPQPAFIALLASGYSPIYPCHVSPRDMRSKPDRHGTLQIRRIQGQRVDQGGAQSGLLEARPALP